VKQAAGLFRAIPVAAFLLVSSHGALGAQDSPESEDGFLFERPRVSLGVRGGMFLHRADSDLYDFTTERFTLDRSDYRGVSVGLEVGAWIGNRAELSLSLDGSRVTLDSQYRDWDEEVDGPGGETTRIPILQTTRLRHGPAISAGIRWYLWDRGDQLGRFIWVPREWNAYLGAGAGLMAYNLRLEGDFVDEVSETISTQRFDSKGNTAFPYVAAGFEYGLMPRLALAVEGRYQWGSHDLGADFDDFVNPLDLAGGRFSFGIQYRL
jgi:hypothetical protein